MGYKTCLADPDLWMSPTNRLRDGFEYYEYILIYVENDLTIGNDPTEVLQKTCKNFVLKSGSLSNLNIYISSNIKVVRVENRVVSWSLIPL